MRKLRGFSHNIVRRTFVRQLKYTRSDYIVTAVLLLVMLIGLAVGTWGLHWASYVNVARMIRQFLPPLPSDMIIPHSEPSAPSSDLSGRDRRNENKVC